MPEPRRDQIDLWWTPCAGRAGGRAHAALREILAGYRGVDGAEIGPESGLWRDPRGKLYPTGGDGLAVSLSYAGDWALCAVARAVEIGVDCEVMAPLDDAADVAALCFAPQERALLARLPPPEQLALFYRLWTRKEALVKALGLGLAYPLTSLSVAQETRGGPVAVEVPGWGRFWVCDLPAPPGHAAACASREPFTVRLRQPWSAAG